MIKILGNNKDKFGFYQTGPFQTYSKMEAIELHRRIGIHPHWNFNEAEFSNYDWTVEPTETLEELYAKRAQQIRESYDYVVLFYSGGADSGNVLDSFVNNNIKFDEIATYSYWAADPNPDNFFNSEQLKVSYPRIEQLQKQGLKFRHRIVDLSDTAAKILTDDTYRFDRVYYGGGGRFGVSHLARGYIREIVPDYQRMIDQGKKIVFVWGTDKPRLYKENDRYCIRFIDIIESGISNRTQIVNRDWEYDELFYWSPDAIDIVCKQGHILKRFFEKYKIYKEDSYYSDTLIDLPNLQSIFSNRNTEDGLSYRNLINTLVYPGFNDRTFTVGKIPGLITSARDTVFNKDNYFKVQLKFIRSHLSQIDTYWLNDPQDIEKGIKGCISPPYYLE